MGIGLRDRLFYRLLTRKIINADDCFQNGSIAVSPLSPCVLPFLLFYLFFLFFLLFFFFSIFLFLFQSDITSWPRIFIFLRKDLEIESIDRDISFETYRYISIGLSLQPPLNDARPDSQSRPVMVRSRREGCLESLDAFVALKLMAVIKGSVCITRAGRFVVT